MATPSKIQLGLGEWPQYYKTGITPESSELASLLLQQNHDHHHVVYNDDGFHNHMAHHLLTLWALSANPEAIQSAYDANTSYQLHIDNFDKTIDLSDPETWNKNLYNPKAYASFLKFFQDKMTQSGWQNAVNDLVFSGDGRADDLFVRLFAGIVHPLIHLGFGVEFNQPAIIAEGLAQAAVHDNWIGKLMLPTERAAKVHRSQPSKSIVELLDEIRADPDLPKATRFTDIPDYKVRDGVIARGGDRMVELASQFHITPEELDEKTAEMTNAAVYMATGSQREGYIPKFCFYHMHCVNSSIFLAAFQHASWLSPATKARLLEWKVYFDLAVYASGAAPEISLDRVRAYKPKHPSEDWTSIFNRAIALSDDDGHVAKLMRALAHGQKICEPYEDRETFKVKQKDWLLIGHMAIDSVEADGPIWVRSPGFEEAWAEVPRVE